MHFEMMSLFIKEKGYPNLPALSENLITGCVTLL